ncbi:hypothetical protein QBC37DRAFT_379694 [Rhypophila decipiens]|uniref:Uncharacterized protein n=1 Tax=Rhypophila decipiens TaxID=261697 RepID=A0AAN6Y1X4_9PEZI|nr:hypothetical protein QBC37DRAFT_379694 [Rhypophila decipiens]
MAPPDLAASPTRESFCAVDLEKEEAALAAATTTANNKKRRGICRKCFVIPALVLFYVASIVAFSAGFYRLGWVSGDATGYQDGVQAMEAGVDYLMNHIYAKGLEQGRRESSDLLQSYLSTVYTTSDFDDHYMAISADFDYAAGMEQGLEQCRRGDQVSPRDDPQSPENKDWVFKGAYMRVAADGKTVHYNKSGWDDVWTDDGGLHYFYNPDVWTLTDHQDEVSDYVWSVIDHQNELTDYEDELADDDALPPRLAKRIIDIPGKMVATRPEDQPPGAPDPEEHLRKLEASKWEWVKRIFRKGKRIIKNWYHAIEEKWKDTNFYKYKLHAHPRPPPIKIKFENHTQMGDHMHGAGRYGNRLYEGGLKKRTTIPVPIPAPAPTNGPYANNGNPNNYAGNGDRYITKGIPRLSKVDHNWANSQFETPKGPFAKDIQPTGGTGLRLPDPYKHNNNNHGPAPVQDAPRGEDLNWHLPQTTKASEFTVTYYIPTTYPDGQVATHTVVRVGPLLEPLAKPTPAPVPATPSPTSAASGSDHTTTLTMGTDVFTITLPGGLKATPWPFLPSPSPSSIPSVVPAVPDAEDAQETQVVEFVEEVEIVQVTEVTEVTAIPTPATTEAPQASGAPEEYQEVDVDLYVVEDENGEFVISTSIVRHLTVTEPIPQASEVAEEFADHVVLHVSDQNGIPLVTATGVGHVISTSTVGYPTVTEQPIPQQSQVVEHVLDVAKIAVVDQHGIAHSLVYTAPGGKLVTVTRTTVIVTSTTETPHASQAVEVEFEFDEVTKVKVADATSTEAAQASQVVEVEFDNVSKVKVEDAASTGTPQASQVVEAEFDEVTKVKVADATSTETPEQSQVVEAEFDNVSKVTVIDADEDEDEDEDEDKDKDKDKDSDWASVDPVKFGFIIVIGSLLACWCLMVLTALCVHCLC